MPYSYLLAQCLMMGISEQCFWESTPRKIIALIDQKNEIEKVRAKNQAIYIACYFWGKDPDEFEGNSEGLVAGRDRPIDPNALNCLLM